jgi:hypothetical protein
MGTLAAWAQELASVSLAEPLPKRWEHVDAVAAKAAALGSLLNEGDAELLLASAWLHDVGYGPDVVDTGFHPLDGARFIRTHGGSSRLYSLVANHSGALIEARLRGLEDELGEFPDEQSLVRDSLWYCDMTTGPSGDTVTFAKRLDEICSRYGPEHTVPRAISEAADEITAAIERVRSHARQVGILLSV